MSQFYGPTHRQFQDASNTRKLADRLEELAHKEFDDADREFIAGAAMFFLSSVDERGRPTVSYKGGPPGFVRITGASELIFPIYDGNGMFLSLGNIVATAQVGLLFIDFEQPRRLRLQGMARMVRDDAVLATYAGARFAVSVTVEQIFVNCGRYIHQSRAALSPHLPDASGTQPFPTWKRIDFLPVLSLGRTPQKSRRTVARSRLTFIGAKSNRQLPEHIKLSEPAMPRPLGRRMFLQQREFRQSSIAVRTGWMNVALKPAV